MRNTSSGKKLVTFSQGMVVIIVLKISMRTEFQTF